VEVFAPTQPCAAHAASVQDMGKAAFQHLAAFAHRLASDAGFQAGAIGVDRLVRFLVTVPAQDAFGRQGL